MRNMKIIGALLGVVLIGSSLSGCASSNKTKVMSDTNKTMAAKKTMNKSKMAAEFELKDLQGKTVKLADYSGKKVYIKFWASWCSICLAGLEEINTLAKDNKDFEVITIVSPGFRGEKTSEDFKKWFSGLDYKNLTVLLDEDGKVANKYEVRGYPTSVVIGKDGGLVKTLLGHSSNEKIMAEFKDVK